MKYEIEDLYAEAYNSAIINVISAMNDKMGTHYFYARDWAAVHELIAVLGIKFDENGEILR